MKNKNEGRKNIEEVDEEDVISSIKDDEKSSLIEEKDDKDLGELIDEDSDNPPAGTPGHPGLDEDAR
jgi:hypothetical protein